MKLVLSPSTEWATRPRAFSLLTQMVRPLLKPNITASALYTRDQIPTGLPAPARMAPPRIGTMGWDELLQLLALTGPMWIRAIRETARRCWMRPELCASRAPTL